MWFLTWFFRHVVASLLLRLCIGLCMNINLNMCIDKKYKLKKWTLYQLPFSVFIVNLFKFVDEPCWIKKMRLCELLLMVEQAASISSICALCILNRLDLIKTGSTLYLLSCCWHETHLACKDRYLFWQFIHSLYCLSARKSLNFSMLATHFLTS